MRAEFHVAVLEGRPFAFAAGCLVAAWSEMPNHGEGRLVLTNYAVALGLLIPMAVLQFALAFGSSSVFFGGEAFSSVLLAGATHHPLLASSQIKAAPCLLALWLMLGTGHLHLAWALVERNWARVVKVSAFVGATLVALFIITGALFLDETFVILQAAALAIELSVLIVVARQHARIFPNADAEIPAR
ncbi:hypothetical protein [Alteraurantiacibacter aestuarii]|uniref:Uncharacterized protein n=1 Tax=Alteraurantiacibacter aestuarii TaxID=650004 RepID=A0A844ZUB1_9SPHN|nr:hypothetical protein [Alteraurantiacibacter aestuarii]MXO89139.1 hypothetical protein [Alteraurantiacibacter aestuarii]